MKAIYLDCFAGISGNMLLGAFLQAGVPQEYLRTTSSYRMTPEQRVEWEAEVRSLYHDGMVRIVVTPTWAKLIDFETTLPSAVEELIRQRAQRQS